jgi:hypothetical protein
VSGRATRASQGLIDVERQGTAPATVSRDACALSEYRQKKSQSVQVGSYMDRYDLIDTVQYQPGMNTSLSRDHNKFLAFLFDSFP